MKKRLSTKLCSLVLSLLLIATAIVPSLAVQAKGQVTPDGATDNWQIDTQTQKGAEVCLLENGKLHIKSDPGNANNPGNPHPAAFANNTLGNVDFSQPGFFEATFETIQDGALNRGGIYLNYQDPGNALMIGFDKSGWFWQEYSANSGAWYSGGRQSSPQIGTPVTIRLEWNAGQLTLATANGVNMFDNMPNMSNVGGTGNKIALKAGSWGTELTDLYVYDIKYSGQATVDVMTVKGTVTNSKDGLPVANVVVKADNGEQTFTNASGEYEFTDKMLSGTHTLTFEADRFVADTKTVNVASADVSGQDIVLNYETWAFDGSNNPAYQLKGIVIDDTTLSPVAGVTVSAGGKTATTAPDGTFAVQGLIDGIYNITYQLSGYDNVSKSITVNGISQDLGNVMVTKQSTNLDKLETSDMEVYVDPDFPRVVRYVMKSSGKVMMGNTKVLDEIKINGTTIKPTVTSAKASNNESIEYTLNAVGTNVDADIKVKISVKDNTLSFDITDITNNLTSTVAAKDETGTIQIIEHPVQTIEIPGHSLVSVNSIQPNSSLAAANISNDTSILGDVYKKIGDMSAGTEKYVYAFIYNDELSAGLWTNSDTAGGRDQKRIKVDTTLDSGITTMGLSSDAWYYDRKISTNYKGTNKNEKWEWVISTLEMPSCKVVINDDVNGDSKVDWQDAAIGYRDIMNSAPGASQIPEMVAWRIVMNFGSMAQNPFMMTADNLKKVALHTDGLGQSLLLKGYGNEGHDSAHPDYADIGTRIGGADDMASLIKIAGDYGVRVGIHINAGEMYPEAKAFSEDMILRNPSTGKWKAGWDWIDKGVAIDTAYDLATDSRINRMNDLRDTLNSYGTNLDFIYLDIWGNGTGYLEDAWATRRVIEDINSNGWIFGTEFPWVGEQYVSFYHWAMDINYGGSTTKGINSHIIRFIRNHERDTWQADNTSKLNGAAIAPLLGGYNMKDFEGWQGRSDYSAYIENLYAHNISTKFLQHFEITKWEDDAPTTVKGGAVTPEKYIKLEGDLGTVEITRKTTNTSNLSDYRTREITLNGKKIIEGEMAYGDTSASVGTETYLIPWNWDTDGVIVANADEKLYHWNAQGGVTTWDLPSSWNVSTVKMYKLTDLGREHIADVNVAGGQVTLTADAATPYVLYKGEPTKLKLEDIEWGEKSLVKDSGFNSGSLDTAWDTTKINGSAVIEKTQAGNAVLVMNGESELSQKITGLTAGQKYDAYVAVDNRSNSKAMIRIEDNGTVLAENYTLKSIAKNYVKADPHGQTAPTTDGKSYFQFMHVFFEAPANGEVTLVLAREAGTGSTYFDDARFVKTQADNIKQLGTQGQIELYEQDFEDNAAGLYPFVVGGIEGSEDNRTHLAELHAPYTQAGSMDGNKEMDDVLDGDWSIKTHALADSVNSTTGVRTGRTGLAYQTIPQNIRFEPGVTYQIEFDYQMGSAGIFQFVVGDGEYNSSTVKVYEMDMARGTTKTAKFMVTGSDSGQTWIGIRAAGKTADITPADYLADIHKAEVSGRTDFVLDNLVVTASAVDRSKLVELVDEARGKYQKDYEPATWTPFANELSDAIDDLNDFNATQADIDKAVDELQAAIDGLKAIVTDLTGVVKDDSGNPLAGVVVTLRHADFANQMAVTNANGEYEFKDIFVRDYTARITELGYEGVYREKLTLALGSNNKDFQLAVKTPPDYRNTFDNGDVSMMKNHAIGGHTANSTFKPTVNGDAAEINFSSSNHTFVIDSNSPLVRDGRFEADITIVDKVNRIGIGAHATNTNGTNTGFMVGTEDSGNKFYSEYWSDTGSGWVNGVTNNDLTLEMGETYHFDMRITNGKEIIVYIDGVEVFKQTVTNSKMPLDFGHIGFYGRNDGTFIIDNIEVTSNDPAPAGTQNVSGTVTDDAGNAIYNVTVNAVDGGGNVIATGYTDIKGNYTVKAVQQGVVDLVFTKNGYNESTLNATVGTSDLTGQDAVLVYIQILSDLYDANKGNTQGNYTDASWKDFTDALAEAKKVLDNKQSTQAEVDKAEADLTQAINDLKLKPGAVDKSKLQKEYDDNQGKNQNDYTPATWADFDKALKDAKTVLDDANATQTQINKAEADLKQAVANLQPKQPVTVDKSKLQKEYDDNQGKNQNDYTPATWADFDKALKDAKTVLDDVNATQTQVNAAETALKQASAKLQPKQPSSADKSKLQKEYDNNQGKTQSDYTSATWADFDKALKDAKTILNDINATQAQIDKAEKDLKDALSAMVYVAELNEWIKVAEDRIDNSSTYTKESVESLKNKIDEVKKVLAKSNVTQNEVNTAILDLKGAIKGLVTISGEKLTLKGIPNSVKVGESFTLTPSYGTQADGRGWKWDKNYFSVTFNKDGSATFKALKSGSSTISFTSNSGTIQTVSTVVTIKDKSPSAATGDNFNIAIWVIVFTISIGGVLFYIYKRKNKSCKHF